MIIFNKEIDKRSLENFQLFNDYKGKCMTKETKIYYLCMLLCKAFGGEMSSL